MQALLVLHQPLHQLLEEERRRAKASAYAVPRPPTAAAAAAPSLPLGGRLPQPLLQLGRVAKSSASFAYSSRASKSTADDPVDERLGSFHVGLVEVGRSVSQVGRPVVWLGRAHHRLVEWTWPDVVAARAAFDGGLFAIYVFS